MKMLLLIAGLALALGSAIVVVVMHARRSHRNEEEARRRGEEARLAAEAETKRKADEEERTRGAAEAEARRQAEEAARLAAEPGAKRKLDEERARTAAEAEAKRKAEEHEQARAEAEARRQAEEHERTRGAAEAEARRQAEEAARFAAEAEAKRKAEEHERAQAAAEVEARRQAEEAARLTAEAETKRKLEEERTRAAAEAEAKRKAVGEARRGAAAPRKAVGEAARRTVAAAPHRKAVGEARRAAMSEVRRRASEAARLSAEQSVHGGLRLCAMLDRVAGAACFTIRATMNREFPDAGLILKGPSPEDTFFCEGELLRWSTLLRDAESRACTDGACFDWSAGVELRDERLGWRFRLQGRPVRVFRNGEGEGLRGLLEVSQLSPGVPFVIAARSDCWQKLEAWGQSSCRQFDRVSVRHGVPDGWALYCAAAAHSDEQVRSDFPNLTFPNAVRLLLRGGIHKGRGSTYFHFSLPVVLLEGGAGEETIRCDGTDLQPDDGIYHLPQNLPAATPISVEARRAARLLKRRWFTIVDDFDCQWSTPHQLFDRFGCPVDVQQGTPVGMVGAALHGVPRGKPLLSPPESCFERRPGRGTRCRWGRVFFVGSVPGQIVSWPREALPTDWVPVWAIPMSRRGRALFCGVDVHGGAVRASGAAYPAKKVRLWKEIVHYRRKKITPPSAANLVRLFQQFQEEARRVRA